MHSFCDIARMQQRTPSRHALPRSFPPTPGSGLLDSTTLHGRSTSQLENLHHSWSEALESLSVTPLEHAAAL